MRHHAILFLCTHNTIRSVVAEHLMKKHFGSELFIESAGLDPLDADMFTQSVLSEIGIDISDHEPHAYDDLSDQNHDVIIALSRQSFEKAQDIAKDKAVDIEYWSLPRPPQNEGSREMILGGYRRLREEVDKHILNRFGTGNDNQNSL